MDKVIHVELELAVRMDPATMEKYMVLYKREPSGKVAVATQLVFTTLEMGEALPSIAKISLNTSQYDKMLAEFQQYAPVPEPVPEPEPEVAVEQQTPSDPSDFLLDLMNRVFALEAKVEMLMAAGSAPAAVGVIAEEIREELKAHRVDIEEEEVEMVATTQAEKDMAAVLIEMQTLWQEVHRDALQQINGSKRTGVVARNKSVTLGTKLKEFRALSVKLDKSR